MINNNGTLVTAESFFLSKDNRGYKFGDAVFETIKVVHGRINFLEDHYLRLMASMRILRMQIPMELTMEFFQEQIEKTVKACVLEKQTARVRYNVYRDADGLYAPTQNTVAFFVEASILQDPFYVLQTKDYEVDLFKDFYVSPGLLSSLKTNNKALHIVGSIYAKENGLQNGLLLNTDKNVVEALNGNLFLVKGNVIKTPAIKDGCLNGIIRKQLLAILEKSEEYTLIEDSISAFELQKADELFITNTIVGIQPITKYRKKKFANTVAKSLIAKLNIRAKLG